MKLHQARKLLLSMCWANGLVNWLGGSCAESVPKMNIMLLSWELLRSFKVPRVCAMIEFAEGADGVCHGLAGCNIGKTKSSRIRSLQEQWLKLNQSEYEKPN
ncbi:hypothetical protein V8E53_009335 [Lactarius tabidus]